MPEAAVGLVWGVSFIATLWRYAGPARLHSSNFVLATGITLLVFQCFSGLMVCLFKYLRNPPFGFVWVYGSLLLTNLVMHISILGSDIARVTLDPDHAPFNLLEYDVATVVCQSIFVMGVFALAFNAGSHTAPPAWAHPRRSYTRGSSEFEETGVEYAAAGEAPSHTIGQGDPDDS